MINIGKNMLPKRISLDNMRMLVGETAHWFCPTCRKWRTSSMTENGIACSVCGGGPDWKKSPPTLAYKSRYRRVLDLCAENSEWRAEYDRIEERYGDFIEQTHLGMSARTKDVEWHYFANAWNMVDKVADYMLSAQDSPKTNIPHAYSADGLRRRYFDSRRKCNVSSLSELDLNPAVDDGGVRLTDQEAVEIMSFQAADSQRFCDTYFPNEFLSAISDPLERSIAYDFSKGAKKRDIERKYELSESQVRTKVAHIAKALKNL